MSSSRLEATRPAFIGSALVGSWVVIKGEATARLVRMGYGWAIEVDGRRTPITREQAIAIVASRAL